ncbi:MAG: hypothetical protein KF763_14775 [Cyclobacteriaceae bacterium]|nr:hypothetical protein [Cyclobacteriaceae bacterium]
MIRLLLPSVLALLIFSSASAQAPKGINYQGVARDNEGKPIASKTISVRISILQNSAQGNVEYSETHNPLTNPFGLFTLVIGQGTVTSGNFAFVSWAIGNKWLQIEIDPAGGSSYQLAGSQQLMSVPYAFYAEFSGNNSLSAGTGIAINNGVITNTGDADNSITNELITGALLTADKKLRITDAGGTKEVDLAPVANQSLTLSGTTLSISGGNSVNIGSVNTDNQNLSLGAVSGTNRTINISNGTPVTLDVADNDNSITNEIQDLSLNAATNQLSLTNDATPVDLTPYKQTLTYTAGTNSLAISGGNSVNITTTLAQTLTNNPNASGIRIQNVGAPTAATDATTKGYVDTAIATAIATNYAFKSSFSFQNLLGVFNDSPVALTDVFDDFNVVATNRFTAPAAGVYSFTVTGSSSLGGIPIKLRITSGSTTLYEIKRTQAYPVVTIINYYDSNIYKLNAGDTVEVVVTSLAIGERVDGLFFGSKL